VPAGDEVYVGTQSVDRRSEIHRFSAQTGQKLSTAHTWPGVLETQIGPSTAIMRSPDGQVMGINARTGDRQWGFQPANYPAAIESDGKTVVVGSKESVNGIYEPQESPMDLSFSSDLAQTQSLAPGADGGWLVHTGQFTGQGRLNSLDEQGTVKWSVPVATGGPQHAPAMLPNGTALSTNFNGYVSAHDATDGHELWRFQTDQTYVNRPDVGPNGQVVVSTCQGTVSQLDAAGKATWTTDTGDRVQRAFVHEDGTVFVQHPQSLEALDPATGKSLQMLPIQPGDLVQGADGNLFSLGKGGILQRIVLE
jgi:outer membrane protein assembly factor BamB